MALIGKGSRSVVSVFYYSFVLPIIFGKTGWGYAINPFTTSPDTSVNR